MTRPIDWNLYEQRKAEIQKQNLSPDEYEKAIRQLVEDLDSESDED